jgi:type I restriction enzyme S subunit
MSEQASLDSISSEEGSANDTKESSASQGKQDKIRIGPYPYTLPEGWSVTQLGKQNEDDKPICYGILKPGEFVEDGVPMVKIEDLEGNKLQQEGVHKVSEELDEEFSRSRLSGGEVLISIQGTIGRMAVVPEEFEGNISRTIARISPEDLNSYWLKSYMLSSPARKLMEALTVGSTRASLNIGELRDFELLTPPLPEQRRIASVLYNMDQAIQKTEEIIEQTQRVKKGLIKNLTMRGFHHESLREIDVTPGFLDIEIPKNWEKVTYDEVSENITYGFTSPMPETESGPWRITAKDIHDGKINYDEASKTSKEAYEEKLTSKSRPEVGTVLVTKDGTLGRVGIVDKENICINQSVASINPKEDKINPEYLALTLKSPLAKKLIESYNPQTTIGHIKISELAEWEFPLPPLDEQDKIVSIINKVREKLQNEKKQKEQLQRLKKGLMQDLLTGEVRTSESVEVLDEVREVES